MTDVPRVRFTPGKRLAWALIVCVPLFTLGPTGSWLGAAADLVLLVLASLEARALRARLPTLERQMPARFDVETDNRVTIVLNNTSAWPLSGRLRDAAPVEFAVDRDILPFVLQPSAASTLAYDARVARRGSYSFGGLSLRLDGPWGLGAVIYDQPAAAEVRVLPSPRGQRRYDLALRRSALASFGIRSTRVLGGAGEFEQLREYVIGDALRDLDWKATAKRSHPITRVHGQEQSQSIVIAIDAGRLMAAPLGELSKLDHAIHAALLVAWVALRAGDRVGLLVFARDVLRFVPPARGLAQYQRLLTSLYDLEASDTDADFRAVAAFVQQRVRRRSLLLLFGDLLDESRALPLAAELPKLGAKHVLTCVTLSDPRVRGLAEGPVQDTAQAYTRAAAADVLAERALLKARLGRVGIAVLETSAADLAIAAVNRYLAIKRQHRL